MTSSATDATGNTDKPDDKASEATWIIPLLALLPTVALAFLTDLSTPWLITAWAFWGLAALLMLVGWADMLRHGVRGATGWTTCLIAHTALAWQAAQLAG